MASPSGSAPATSDAASTPSKSRRKDKKGKAVAVAPKEKQEPIDLAKTSGEVALMNDLDKDISYDQLTKLLPWLSRDYSPNPDHVSPVYDSNKKDKSRADMRKEFDKGPIVQGAKILKAFIQGTAASMSFIVEYVQFQGSGTLST